MLTLLVTNLLHGAVALWWVAGLGHVQRPMPPATWARLLALSLILPPVVAGAQLLGAPGPSEGFALLRADLWAGLLLSNEVVVWVGLLVLSGTTWIFLAQELRPVLQRRGVQRHAARARSADLDAVFDVVIQRFVERGVRLPAGRRLRVLDLDTPLPIAALEGVSAPVLLVSRGLRVRLDAWELQAVIAHEVAHWVQGGNRRFLLVWFMRALQAPSPPALVLFRLLVEAREAAADALAAEVTGKPAVLAAALLKLYSGGAAPRVPTVLARARARVLRRAELAATQLRVTALLKGAGRSRSPVVVSAVAVALLLGLLWGIG